jgi:hypothetical protein
LPGDGGEIGQLVPENAVKAATGLSDVRFRRAMRALENKVSAVDLAQYVSLGRAGDDYVLEMGYDN